MPSFLQRWSAMFQSLPTEEKLVIGMVILASLVAIGFYCIRRIRAGIRRPITPVSEHLSEFREIWQAGAIDDDEYSRVVQSVSKQSAESAAADAEGDGRRPAAASPEREEQVRDGGLPS